MNSIFFQTTQCFSGDVTLDQYFQKPRESESNQKSIKSNDSSLDMNDNNEFEKYLDEEFEIEEVAED